VKAVTQDFVTQASLPFPSVQLILSQDSSQGQPQSITMDQELTS